MQSLANALTEYHAHATCRVRRVTRSCPVSGFSARVLCRHSQASGPGKDASASSIFTSSKEREGVERLPSPISSILPHATHCIDTGARTHAHDPLISRQLLICSISHSPSFVRIAQLGILIFRTSSTPSATESGQSYSSPFNASSSVITHIRPLATHTIAASGCVLHLSSAVDTRKPMNVTTHEK